MYPTRGKYAAEVGYSHGPTYHTVYDISFGECATGDEPFCVRRPMPYFTQRLICHITNLIAIRNFLWLHNHLTIYTINLSYQLEPVN